MAAKGADMMIANVVGPGRGFEADENEILIIPASGEPRPAPRLSKRETSRLIFDGIEEALEAKRR
jgi:phosphopantothenoylcysteine synthetase/decarboxylase